MSLEILSNDFHEEMEQRRIEKENTIGCRIKVDDGLVKVIIPQKNIETTDVVDPSLLKPDLILTFSKREVKEFLQDIYTS